MVRGLVRLAAWIVTLLVVVGCRRNAAERADAAPLPVLEAEFAGCAAVLEGPVCELPLDHKLRILVPSPSASPVFSTNVGALAPTSVRGRLVFLLVPEGATELRVDADGKRFVLAIAKAPAYPWILEARALRAKDPEAARIKAMAALGSADPNEKALALGLIARIELSKGQVDEAIAKLGEAIDLARARVSDRADDTFALAFALSQRRGRYAEARQVLDRIAPFLGDYPEGRARLPYYRAEVMLQEGDLRGGLAGLSEAQRLAAALGMVKLERGARGYLATTQQDLGDVDAGIATLRALDEELTKDPEATPCERAANLLNLALTLDRRRETRRDLGEPLGEDEISAPAARAKALFPDACKEPYMHAVAAMVSAEAALTRGAPAEAAALAAEAAAKMTTPRSSDRLDAIHLDARIASARGDFALARDKHSLAHALAEAGHQVDMSWRALVGRGDALEALGDRAAALADYRRAEALVTDVALKIPLGDLRGAYATRSEASARRLISALLRDGHPDEAFAAARRARARLLVVASRGMAVDALDPKARASWDAAVARFRKERSALDQSAENDWKLAANALDAARAERAAKVVALRAALDEAMAVLGAFARDDAPLAQPTEGEVWLAFGRAREGLVRFVATSHVVRASALTGELDLSSIADLETAKRVVVLAYGALRAVDVHALPFHGAPLIERVPVVYALDVARAHAPQASSGVGLVGDPTEDLPSSRMEVKSIAALYPGSRVLIGTEANSPKVLELLGSVETFHLAGHGVFAGLGGNESRFPLSGGTELGLLDILAASRVPRRVILSACESARASLDSLAENLGLAHAFVLAGSEGVVAPTRKVDDALAMELARALHDSLLTGTDAGAAGRIDLGQALQAAQRKLRAAAPISDWAAFRALRP